MGWGGVGSGIDLELKRDLETGPHPGLCRTRIIPKASAAQGQAKRVHTATQKFEEFLEFA